MTRPTTAPPGRDLPKKSASAPAYRTDLDGLRGIAIALVACFHIWFGRVSGGVDVFLTLSGYFFVGSLLKHVIVSQDPRQTLWQTVNPIKRLIRLVRRLLPALIVVLTAISAFAIWILPETRWLATGQEVIASLFYYQNWHLADNSQDYTAASSANSPLQHLWSMSVQGQFFVAIMLAGLLFAGLIKIGARLWPALASPVVIRTVAGIGLLGLAAISFYWAHMRMSVNQPWNYYDTLSRLWEPLVGGLLAIWLPKLRVSNIVRNIVLAAALGLIFSCGWWIDGVGSYPGPLALVPALSTVAIIWAGATALQTGGGPQPLLSRLLAHRSMVWLGSSAYALYLWHWPLLIFYLTWRDKNDASVLEGVGLIAVSLGLAALTKRFIEDPLRESKKDQPAGAHEKPEPAPASGRSLAWRRFARYSTIVTSLLLISSITMTVGAKAWERHVNNMTVDTTNLDPRVYPGGKALLDNLPVPRVDPQPSPLLVKKDLPDTSYKGFISDFTDGGIHVGTYGDPNATRTIALAGGSHAEFWITALDAIGKQDGFKVKTYLKMGCPLSTELVPKQRGVPYPQCYSWVQEVMKMIVADKPDAVFTNSTRPIDGGAGDHTPSNYVDIFKQFQAANIPILGVRDTPWPKNAGGGIDTPDCLSKESVRACSSPRELIFAPVDPAIEVAKQVPALHPLDLTAGICDSTLCPAVVGNIVAYHDSHHLSATFVRSLTPELRRQMRLAIPWT